MKGLESVNTVLKQWPHIHSCFTNLKNPSPEKVKGGIGRPLSIPYIAHFLNAQGDSNQAYLTPTIWVLLHSVVSRFDADGSKASGTTGVGIHQDLPVSQVGGLTNEQQI